MINLFLLWLMWKFSPETNKCNENINVNMIKVKKNRGYYTTLINMLEVWNIFSSEGVHLYGNGNLPPPLLEPEIWNPLEPNRELLVLYNYKLPR